MKRGTPACRYRAADRRAPHDSVAGRPQFSRSRRLSHERRPAREMGQAVSVRQHGGADSRRLRLSVEAGDQIRMRLAQRPRSRGRAEPVVSGREHRILDSRASRQFWRAAQGDDIRPGHARDGTGRDDSGLSTLPFEQAPAHQELFTRLAAGEVPLVFNCSAGKDRAGTAAALILSALGVPRETVVEDYVLTNRVVDLERIFMATAHRSALMDQASGIVSAVLRADPAYLHAALDAVEEKHGTVAAYVRDALGITEEASSAIRRSLLE